MANKIKTVDTLPDVPASKVAEAQMDGIQEAIAEGAKSEFLQTDGAIPGDEPDGITIDFNVMQFQHLVDQEPDVLKDTLKNGQPSLTQGQVAGLLEVERSGKNREDIVKVLCDFLGVKSPYEVTNAGPNYTNVVSRKLI